MEKPRTACGTGRGGTRPSNSIDGGSASTPTALPERKTPAHPPVVDAGNRAIIVFLTVCTKNRQSLLACDHMHALLLDAWAMADLWHVGRYMVMPDHIHLFCAPGTFPPSSVRKWAEYWKGMVARALKGHGPLAAGRGRGGTRPSVGSGGSASTPTGVVDWPSPFWQRDCWDTQLRRGESYHEKWEYVRFNPVRAGLCMDPDEWPFQGCVNDLVWHD